MLQFPNRVPLPCSFHSSPCTHLCLDPQCLHPPYLCSLCLLNPKTHINHQHLITPLQDGITTITRSLHNYKTQFQKALSKSSKRYRLSELQTIASKLNNNVEQMKNKIDAMGQKLVNQFRLNVANVKDGLYQELDKYQRVRLATIQTYKDSLTHFQMYDKLKFYANQSSLFLKLKTELNRKSTQWFQNVKKYIGRSEEIVMESPGWMESLDRVIEEMAGEQIGYVEESIPKQVGKNIQEMAGNGLRQMVFVRSRTESYARKKFRG